MKRIAQITAALFGAVILAGCDASGTANLSFLQATTSTRNLAAEYARLADGDIVVSGPEGYCIDSSTLRSTATSGFAALASCNILSGGVGGPIVEPALLTVTVSPAGEDTPAPEVMAAALDTTVLNNREFNTITVGQMASKGDSAFEGSDPRHWRGAFVINGYLVGLALYAPEGSPLVGGQGASFLNTVSSQIRANSKDIIRDAPESQLSEEALASRLSRLSEGSDL